MPHGSVALALRLHHRGAVHVRLERSADGAYVLTAKAYDTTGVSTTATIEVAECDLSFQPSLRREPMKSLHELGLVERRENVVFLGPPGVGKTHLAISLAIAAAQSGRRVYCGTLADLITSLEEARPPGGCRRLKVLTHPALLVVDEIGYLPISRTGAMLFFQLMTRRYEPVTRTVGRAAIDNGCQDGSTPRLRSPRGRGTG